MRNLQWLLLTLIALLVVTMMPASATAQPATQHFGPFASGSPDSSTCGNSWANDTFQRRFRVTRRQGGTFTVVQQFHDGTFVTIAGASPGACQNASPPSGNGSTVGAGVTGTFQGSIDYTVSGGTYNPNGCANPASCDTSAEFFASVFPGGTFTVDAFSFHYSAQRNGQWKNASANRGGNSGDITGNP